MTRVSMVVSRYWSLAAAFLLPVIETVVESTVRLGAYDEVARTALFVICLALLVHSWFVQRRYAQSRWQLAFWTLFLSLVALGPLWLGLNVIRFYSYDSQWLSTLWYHNLYGCVVELQDVVILSAKMLGILIVLWLIADLARWLWNRCFGKLP